MNIKNSAKLLLISARCAPAQELSFNNFLRKPVEMDTFFKCVMALRTAVEWIATGAEEVSEEKKWIEDSTGAHLVITTFAGPAFQDPTLKQSLLKAMSSQILKNEVSSHSLPNSAS